jgi:hypothetical protein
LGKKDNFWKKARSFQNIGMFVLKSGVTQRDRKKETEFQNHKKDSARKALSTAIRLVPTIKKINNAICSNTIVGYNNRRKSQKRQLEN